MEEMIKELLAAMVTDEMLADAARTVVEERMTYSISEIIKQTVHDILREKTEVYVKECVDKEFAKPVKSDDGWGDVEYYDTFEQFVREYMKRNLSKSWEVQSMVEKQIDEKMKKAKKHIAEKIANHDFADEIIAEFTDEHEFTF